LWRLTGGRRCDLSVEIRPGEKRSSGKTTGRHPVTDAAIEALSYPAASQMEKPMAIKAQRNRAKLHLLRDNVHRAKRDVKRKLPGAAERLKAHVATRLAYAETGK
jgi:hypothetical protein